MLNERTALAGIAPAEAIADYAQALRIRHKVIGICNDALSARIKNDEEEYWVLATCWEAAVGIEDQQGASQWEQAAGQQVDSTKLQAWMVQTTEDQIAKLKALLKPSQFDHI